MLIQKTLFTWLLFLCTQFLCAISLQEQLNQVGYLEMCDTNCGSATYDALYASFDELITFFQENPTWAQKLYIAKERFIRSENRNYYSTDFFGFYDESEREGRNQISFYYSIHFQDFIFSYYREFKQVAQIVKFFEACFAIQQSSRNVFREAAVQLNVENIFFSTYEHPPILLKVVKYFPSYAAFRPHYDGTAFSLFLDSTDNESLLLSPYRLAYTVDDFSSPVREFTRSYNQNSILLIPGTLLTEFFFYPTPHIVEQNGKIRYATIAFAMRPHYTIQKNNFSPLPNFKS
jgi:hypothetical protein